MKKQIILAMLDIEHAFDEYSERIDEMLEKHCRIEERLELMDITGSHFGQLMSIFKEIYEALDKIQ